MCNPNNKNGSRLHGFVVIAVLALSLQGASANGLRARALQVSFAEEPEPEQAVPEPVAAAEEVAEEAAQEVTMLADTPLPVASVEYGAVAAAPVEAEAPLEAAAPISPVAPVAVPAPLTATATNKIDDWAANVAKKTTDQALLTMFDIAGSLKQMYATFDTNNDGTVDKAELMGALSPSLRRQLQMSLAEEPLPVDSGPPPATSFNPEAAMALAEEEEPEQVVATAEEPWPEAASPAVGSPVTESLFSAALAATPTLTQTPPAAAASDADKRLKKIFDDIQKLARVHSIFDADSDGSVSAADLVAIAKA